jgi:carbamoyl-phosphate synthase large subunit
MNGQIAIAVTGINLGENPQPGPGVVRSLREALGRSVRMVGLAYDAMDSSLYAPDLLDDAFLVPYPSAGPTAYLQRLLEIHAQIPLDAIIPCLDVELPVLAEISDALQSVGIRSCLPRREQLLDRSKERLTELAKRVGIDTPETHPILEDSSLSAMGDRLGYPYVLKGPYCDAEIVRGPGEAVSIFTRLATRWGLPLLVQRYVVGEEYDVVCLGDGEGGMPGAVAMRKTMLTRLGKAWGAVTIDDPELIAAARRVILSLRWRGGCEVELLRERSGHIHLIEINPRFPAWVYLATAAGVNLPLGLLKLALEGRAPSFTSARPGVFYVRHATETTGTLADVDALVTRGMRASAPPPPITNIIS